MGRKEEPKIESVMAAGASASKMRERLERNCRALGRSGRL